MGLAAMEALLPPGRGSRVGLAPRPRSEAFAAKAAANEAFLIYTYLPSSLAQDRTSVEH